MVDDNNDNEQQKYLEEFFSYFPFGDEENGCIKAIKEDLERIKKISDLEEKTKVVSACLTKHRNTESNANTCNIYIKEELEKLKISSYETIGKYKKLVNELQNLHNDILIERARRQKTQSSLSCQCSHCHQ